VTAVVEAAVASAMTMAEGDLDSKVERQRMWQWTAALTVDAAIDGNGADGCL
jgi:hypothetical protein